MAGHTENNSLAISYMTQKHLRCCCVDSEPNNTPCVKCKPVQQICCLLVTHSLWVKKFVFVRLYPGPTFGEEGDPCTEKGATNLCGRLHGRWPVWPHPCQSMPTLPLVVSNHCKTVRMVYQLSSGALTASASVDLPRDWFAGPVVIENVPGGGDVTIEPCPDPWPDAFTEEEATTEFLLRGWRQSKQSGTWTTDGYWVTSKGVCLCGHPVWCPGANPFSTYATYRLYWRYDLYVDKTVVLIELNGVEQGRKEFDGSGCAWSDTAFWIYHTADANIRWKIVRVENCDTAVDPPPDGGDECDPGCWPTCVKCPTRKDLALSVTQADSCCLHGVFPLTYNSGSDNYTLAAPVGGPVGTCGQIIAATVSCVDLTHVSLYIQLKETGGSVGSPSTVTLTATCVDGEMETSSVHIYGLLFDLCGIGFPLGADIRVITI